MTEAKARTVEMGLAMVTDAEKDLDMATDAGTGSAERRDSEKHAGSRSGWD